MKVSIAAIVLTALTTVNAGSPDFWPGTHKFSRKAMAKWQEYFPYDEMAAHWYSSNIGQTKKWVVDESKPARTASCPADLKNANIQLLSAEGSYKTFNKLEQRFPSIAKRTSDLNDITYVYLINEGICGKLSASTKLDYGLTGALGFHWERPGVIFPEVRSDRGFDIKAVKISTGDALKKVQEKYKIFRYGFKKVTLNKKRFMSRDQPVYTFEAVREDGETTAVHVSAVNGYADIDLEQPEEEEKRDM